MAKPGLLASSVRFLFSLPVIPLLKALGSRLKPFKGLRSEKLPHKGKMSRMGRI
uniref:Uncharacterized protein n=1 Tax=Myoviridae sp. ctHMa1 TaxID=2827671 RepID=A0A8S5SFP7_9CAUD|nr:MAG TPA: hypothetical protein [Myoviridae sp. ctHMa1]